MPDKPQDTGFFGPDSVTWRVHEDPSMLIGGVRALLIQALNPRAIAAVVQHSNYKSDPWKRLMRTTAYIYTTTFGDKQTALAAGRAVQAVHRRIKGVDDFTGLPYSAEDPELLLWIHCVEVHSFLTAYKRYGRRISDEDADRYVAEMVRAAELVGLEAGDVPSTRAELNDYLRAQELVLTPGARDTATFILKPPVPLPGGRVPAIPGGRLLIFPGRALWSLVAAGAIATLPEKIRKLYGLPWVAPAGPALQVSLRVLGRTVKFLPPPPPIKKALAHKRALVA
jgi:uncharacterized protein (DUF2236 family)